MLRALVAILNFLSALEFRIADKLGEATAIIFHFFLFWMFPIILLYLPSKICTATGIIIALFYVFVLAGDVFFSVFGHEKLEKKRGMIDITSVHEMREEIISALVKYIGGIISFATIYNGLQHLFQGKAFIISHPTPIPYFDLLYFSLVTITTVGYGNIQPGLWVSKIFVASEILFGVGFALLLITMLISVYIDIQRKKKYK
ncbi:MAG: two pore domain potassium channel family protein [Candidatus Aminicenantes bacterium]|nr:MAG: two pore domain potassium channel family protein [Candidatus Aminicenantes bacterium]